MYNIISEFGTINCLAQAMFTAILASFITLIFHKIYITDNKVIYKIFNIICALCIQITLNILLSFIFIVRITFGIVIQEILLIIFTSFLSQLWYDWIKELINMIKNIHKSALKEVNNEKIN